MIIRNACAQSGRRRLWYSDRAYAIKSGRRCTNPRQTSAKNLIRVTRSEVFPTEFIGCFSLQATARPLRGEEKNLWEGIENGTIRQNVWQRGDECASATKQ